MSISKKHYVAISKIVRNNYDKLNNNGEYDPSISTQIIVDLANYFKNEDLKRFERVRGAKFKFDSFKFIEACYPEIKKA